jgi:S1-C subfamily serine protease
VDGNYVAPPEFDDFFMLTKELAKFWIGCDSWRNCSNAKQGIYSIAQGKTIVNPRYEFIALAGDLIAVKADGKFGYIDINGKNVIEPKFSRGGIFADGLAQVDFPENYIDTTGKYVYKGTIGTLQPKAKESPEPASIGITPVNGAILKKSATGTAFIVSKSGQVITNHHVIDGCKEVRIEGRDGLVKVSTSDVVNDLALLQVPGTANATAAINSDPAKLRQGDDIVVYGFPLNSVLSSGGNLTPGVVSALTGLGNNTNQIQITAPIQPGSSGSPVLNKKGEVVGVVAMKLSDSKMAKATGQIGQNVNFAVSGQTLKSFLDTHKVDYSKSGFMNFDKSTADIADEAKKWTTVVECWK